MSSKNSVLSSTSAQLFSLTATPCFPGTAEPLEKSHPHTSHTVFFIQGVYLKQVLPTSPFLFFYAPLEKFGQWTGKFWEICVNRVNCLVVLYYYY